MKVPSIVSAVCLSFSTLHAAIATDYNTDGLCDVWQQYYNAWSLTPTADDDGDGLTNFQESVAGTDPRDPTDYLRIANTQLVDSSVVLKVEGIVGKQYQILCSWGLEEDSWTPEGDPLVGTGADLTFTVPHSAEDDRRFYKVEVIDIDTDNDGVSDWAEAMTGTDPTLANSPANASGGSASDAASLDGLLALSVSQLPGAAQVYEKEGGTTTLRFSRSTTRSSTVVTIPFVTQNHTDITKGTATGNDFTFTTNQTGGTVSVSALGTSGSVTLPAGVSEMDVTLTPLSDNLPEVPELLTLKFYKPGSGPLTVPMLGSINISDATPQPSDNRTLFVAYLTKAPGVNTTATGIATALVQGDNNQAELTLNFSNLSSPQITGYLRIDSDLEITNVGSGQVSSKVWPIRAAQSRLTDQAMLTALHAGQLYISITTADNPTAEILGYFHKVTGSSSFTYNPDLHDAPEQGSADWQNPTGEALERDIWRFLEQCTFGGTPALYQEVLAAVNTAISNGGTYLDGYASWLDKQIDPAITPNPSLLTLTMAADNEEFLLRGNKPLWSGNDPQFGDVSYNVSYDTLGNPIDGTSNGTYNNNHPAHNNRRREQWTLALQSKAQVRQRVAQALSEIMVISEIDTTVQSKHYGAAAYWDTLADGAFGKYRDLLEKVTFSPMMGIYLSHLKNRGTYVSGGVTISPDENYAREIMQLFSIGLVLRHPDGSLVLGPDGLPIPTYDNNDITELARVLTGITFGARHANASVSRFNGLFFSNPTNLRVSPTIEIQGVNFTNFNEGNGDSWWQASWIYPMKVLGKVGTVSASSPPLHDFGQKVLLAGKHGHTLIPEQTVVTATADATSHTMAATDLRLAHNCLAGDPNSATYNGHQNTPINISRWLIQRLTTSNPSAGYLYRVSEKYRQTNGNLGEVVKAIFLDYEARSLKLADESIAHGRMKEPLVHFMSVIRALNGYTGVPLTSLKNAPLNFSENESPSTAPYPQAEVDKFVANASRFRFGESTGQIGQSPLRAPSVFNWFLPDYAVPGAMSEAGLVAPEMQIATETNIVARVNRLWSFTWMQLTGMTAFAGVDVDDVVQITGSAGPQVKISNTQPPTTATENSFLALRTFTFTPANWNTAQTVTVAAVDDTVPEGPHTTRLYHSTASTDSRFNNLGIPSLTVNINDNEAAGNARVIVTETGTETMVVEGGATDTYTLALSQAPTAPVTINLQTTVNNVGTYTTEVTVSPTTVTFTSANWSTPRTITVTAVNDTTSEAIESTQIGHVISTTDPLYKQITAPPVNVIVGDNDNNGSNAVSLLQTQNSTLLLEGGAADHYYYALRRAPNPTTASVNVAITIAQDPTKPDITASPSSMTFNNTNWNIPQRVVLTAVDDTLVEGTEVINISNVATGGSYNLTNTISATVLDNDGGSVVITQTGGNTTVSETSANSSNNPLPANLDTYTLRLGSQPTANVTVTVTAERHPRPMSNWAKISGYYGGDIGGTNLQKDRVIFDYTDLITIYNNAYTAAGGNTTASNAHFAGTMAVINELDLRLCGGSLKAQSPALALADLTNTEVVSLRKSIVQGVYRGYSITRLSTDTTNYNNEVRDRCRIAAYLISISPASMTSR